jgi:hypothetical protein
VWRPLYASALNPGYTENSNATFNSAASRANATGQDDAFDARPPHESPKFLGVRLKENQCVFELRVCVIPFGTTHVDLEARRLVDGLADLEALLAPAVNGIWPQCRSTHERLRIERITKRTQNTHAVA